MADYIEREKVTELIDYHQEEYCEAESYFGLLKEDFQELPSADVAPVVHGKWVKTDDDPEDTAYQCSVCGKEALYKYNTCDSVCSEYCPQCGAKMDLLN